MQSTIGGTAKGWDSKVLLKLQDGDRGDHVTFFTNRRRQALYVLLTSLHLLHPLYHQVLTTYYTMHIGSACPLATATTQVLRLENGKAVDEMSLDAARVIAKEFGMESPY